MKLRQIVAAERLLSETALAAAARRADDSGEPLVVWLIAAGVADDKLAAAVARQLGVPQVALDDPAEVDGEALRQVPLETARARRLVPLALETPRSGPQVLRLAMADPTDQDAITEIENASGCRVETAVAPLGAIEAAQRVAYRGFVTAVMAPDDDDLPRRTPFGGELSPRTVQTQPFRHLEDEAPFELRHRALLQALVQKGVLTWEEYAVELRRLLGREP